MNEIPAEMSSEKFRGKHALNKALSDCGHTLFLHRTQAAFEPRLSCSAPVVNSPPRTMPGTATQ